MAHKPGFFRQALSTVAQPFKEMIASFRGGRKKTTKEQKPFAPRKVGFAQGHRMWKKVRDEQDRRAGNAPQTTYSGDGTAQLEPKKQEIIPGKKNRSFQQIVDEQSAQVSGDLTIPYTPHTPDAPNAPTTPKTVYRAKSTGGPFTILQS